LIATAIFSMEMGIIFYLIVFVYHSIHIPTAYFKISQLFPSWTYS